VWCMLCCRKNSSGRGYIVEASSSRGYIVEASSGGGYIVEADGILKVIFSRLMAWWKICDAGYTMEVEDVVVAMMRRL
jgi:hypothetical protein